MEDHPRVLQERIQVRAFGGRRKESQEGVRRKEHEGEEPHADQTHHARDARRHFGGELFGREGDRGGPPAERHDPEEDRALVAAPGGGDLVVPRQHRVGVVRHVEDRKVRDVERIRQTAERDRAEKGVRDRRGPRHRHQRAVALGRADEGHHPLDDRERQAEDECKVTDFRNHLCISGE